MQNRSLGWVILAVGLAIAVLALLRDALFPGPSAGFGFQQAVALVVGLGIALVGWLVARRG